MTIESVYPNINPGIRPLFHRVFNPIHPSVSNLSIRILWPRDGNPDNHRGFSNDPNHFVLLLSEHSTRTRLYPSCNTSTKEISNPPTSEKIMTEPPSFAFKVDDGNFSVDKTSINAFCQTINTETCPVMCARDSDGTKSIPNTLKVKKASSLKKRVCTPHPVPDVGEVIAGGSSPGRVLSDQERHVCLKYPFVPDQNYAHLTTQTLTKGKRKQTCTLKFQTS